MTVRRVSYTKNGLKKDGRLIMNKYTSVSYEWLDWIIESLENGHSPLTLVGSMVEKGYDELVADQLVARLAKMRNSNLKILDEISDNYIYESPRITIKENVIHTSDRDIQVIARLEKPVVVVLDNMLSAEECDAMVVHAKAKELTRSVVVDSQTGNQSVDPVRTSSGTFLHFNESELISRLDQRIAQVMNCPIQNGEEIQILNYKVGKEYKPHYDYFNNHSGSGAQLGNGGQRISTLVIYLNDVVAGGETIFPKIGLSVVPKKGSAVYFEYCNSFGQVNPLTLHGGAPVIQGEKWIATKWMRQEQRN